MMLIVAIAIWLIVALFFVVLCRGAALADSGDAVSTGRYPTGSADDSRAEIAAIVLGKDRPATDLRPRVRGVRGRAGRYVAGS